MVERLRAKPGGEDIPVAIGDFSTTRVDGTFSLAYVVFNTINNLTSQDAQVACFENAAAHLEPGGCFVVEVGVPNRQRLEVFDLSDTHVGVDELDFDTQRLVSHHFNARRRSLGAAVDSVPLRLAGRARPDGPARGNVAPRALERLEARAVHEREHQARLGLGEDVRRLDARRVYYALELVHGDAGVRRSRPCTSSATCTCRRCSSC